ncbi:hypothetical protein K9M59_00085 [Candidatus Gracilibacteria bacterium]|nr:hypothetical protein [Candidatus Gracilibacteria bacterium]MCF7818985.1 hypothetical protein [Candidatus Gracilibacteria bacterium]
MGVEKPENFIEYLEDQGIVFNGENQLEDVITVLQSYHATSEQAILNAFSTLREAKEKGLEIIYVRKWLNSGSNDIKLTKEEGGTNGCLISGGSGQPTHHCA